MGMRKTVLEIVTFESDTAQEVKAACEFGLAEYNELMFAVSDIKILKDEIVPFPKEEGQ